MVTPILNWFIEIYCDNQEYKEFKKTWSDGPTVIYQMKVNGNPWVFEQATTLSYSFRPRLLPIPIELQQVNTCTIRKPSCICSYVFKDDFLDCLTYKEDDHLIKLECFN